MGKLGLIKKLCDSFVNEMIHHPVELLKVNAAKNILSIQETKISGAKIIIIPAKY